MNKPQISIIIPVYNVEKYIRQCLGSIIGQTFGDIEIILVDDVSSDGSLAIAREFAVKDDRVKIIAREKNGGQSAARNSGLKNSSAPFVMFCDSDDFYRPDMCEKMFAAISANGADMAACGLNIIYETDKHLTKSDAKYYKIKFTGLTAVTDELLRKTDASPCNKIWRRALLSKYDINFPEGLRYEDAYFFNACACRVQNIFFLPDKLYNYRRRASSTMSKTFSGQPGYSIDHLKIAIAFYDYLKKHSLLEPRKNYMSDLFFAYLHLALEHEPTAAGQDAIYNLAQDFIRRAAWKEADCSESTQRRIKLLESRRLNSEARKYWGGLVKVKETYFKKKIYLAGIPVWKVRYGNY